MPTCKECGGRQYQFRAQGPLAQVQLCTCQKACSRCAGRGVALVSREGPAGRYEAMETCGCRLLSKRLRCFNAAELPTVLSGLTVDDFVVDGPHAEALRKARTAAGDFLASFQSGQSRPRGVLFTGPVGTGKSHLLAAVLSVLTLERGVRCAYAEAGLLFAAIRRGFDAGRSPADIIQPMAEVEVLVLDELGKGRGTPFELDTLEELVSRRYNAGRVTLCATNCSVDASAGGAPKVFRPANSATVSPYPSLEERVGPRTLSRLLGGCEVVHLPEGMPDRRRHPPASQPVAAVALVR